MPEKFKKIDREFLLTDSTVNVYGFRLMTSGYQINEFKKNPIGYHMHLRDNGVLVKWEDFRVDGDNVYAKPVVNLNHPRGEQTVSEIEDGFLNAASVGHLVALEISNDEKDKLPNQTGPTITKWFNRECSLVDIPGNMNALKLYDDKDNELNLADFTNPQINNMKQIFFTTAMLSAMNLKADSDESLISSAFNDLVAKAGRVDAAEKKLNDLLAVANKEKIDGMISTALSAKKITKELGDKLAIDYASNAEGLKNLLDAMPTYMPITTQLTGEKNWGQDLVDKTWDEIMDAGKLEDLKAKNIDLFKAKFKEEFGREYV